MSKRFIDTDLYDDPRFMKLHESAKIVWIYSITKCNHAGVFELNEELLMFQSKISKSLATVRQQLGNRWVTLDCGKIFIPNFISFQYPNGLHDNVLAQKSVIKELDRFGLWDSKSATVRQQLGNSCLSVKDIYKDKEIEQGNTLYKKRSKAKKTKIKKGDISDADLIFPECVDKKLIEDYFSNRTDIKKPMTYKAKELFLKRVTTFHKNGQNVKACIEKAIIGNWSNIFEEKGVLNGKDNRTSKRKPVEKAKSKSEGQIKRPTVITIED